MSVHLHTFTVEWVEVSWKEGGYEEYRIDAKVMLGNTEVWRQRNTSAYSRAAIGRDSFTHAEEEVLQDFAMALREALGDWGLDDDDQSRGAEEREP